MGQIEIDLTNLPAVTNDKYYPLYRNKDRYLILVGGGSSGKSVYTTQKIIYRMLCEESFKLLACRKVKQDVRDSVFAELVNTIQTWGMTDLFYIPKGRSSELYLKCKNGNEILFGGLDEVERLKSIQGINNLWVEEANELTPEDFRQLDIRVRGKIATYQQLILTFNPVSINSWIRTEFDIDGYFVAHRPNTTCIHSIFKDNRFLSQAQVGVLEGFKGVDDYYYDVYCLGQWGIVGKTIFPAAIVNARIAQLRELKPLKRGLFVYDYEHDQFIPGSIKWIDDPTGYITIYEEPKERYPYVIGGDTAGEGSDYFAGQGLNNVSGAQVAVLHHQFDEDLYARQMYCLGHRYNQALLGVETNFSTFPMKELARLEYPNQFIRESAPDAFTGKLQHKYGFQTTKLTRPLAIANLVKVVREHSELFNDIPTLEEMLTFVRNEQGKAEAQEGKHDDLIMSAAIGHYIREQQAYSPPMDSPTLPKDLPQDVVDDYWSAPESERPRLLKKWGIVK
jgi:phage terminase large subunit